MRIMREKKKTTKNEFSKIGLLASRNVHTHQGDLLLRSHLPICATFNVLGSLLIIN